MFENEIRRVTAMYGKFPKYGDHEKRFSDVYIEPQGLSKMKIWWLHQGCIISATMECDVVTPTEGETKSNYEIARGPGVTKCKMHLHTRTEGVTRVPEEKRVS